MAPPPETIAGLLGLAHLHEKAGAPRWVLWRYPSWDSGLVFRTDEAGRSTPLGHCSLPGDEARGLRDSATARPHRAALSISSAGSLATTRRKVELRC